MTSAQPPNLSPLDPSSANPSSDQPAVSYPARAIARALRAVRCSPFQLAMFATMCWQGVALGAIANSAGVSSGYTKRSLSELEAESALLWLVQVGLLRREVDGQGLTDSFRLTPLGRQLVTQWEQTGFPAPASLWDSVLNAITRWLRLPLWLQ